MSTSRSRKRPLTPTGLIHLDTFCPTNRFAASTASQPRLGEPLAADGIDHSSDNSGASPRIDALDSIGFCAEIDSLGKRVARTQIP